MIEDDDASDLDEISLDDAALASLDVSHATLKHVYLRNAAIQQIAFRRCNFSDGSQILATVKDTDYTGCIISGILKMTLFEVQRFGMDDTVIAGKLYMDNFIQILPAICHHIDASEFNVANQLLTLKENFRQLGEYRNEDLCHLYYHRKATKREPKLWKP